ncbi:MAG: S49 family peptidase, partial [Deltaproteobacteria bacterium]|nr:S49 family peptidase [Deltaproteobacteria bacterium]
SLFRPFTDEERLVLARKVKQFYDLFVGRVAAGRKLSAADVHAVGQGRVWTGDQAKRYRLVDGIGGLRQALERARVLADLSSDAPIWELPKDDASLLDVVLDAAGFPSGQSDGPNAWVPPALLAVARAVVPFAIYEPNKPLARVEMMVEEP